MEMETKWSYERGGEASSSTSSGIIGDQSASKWDETRELEAKRYIIRNAYKTFHFINDLNNTRKKKHNKKNK